MSRNIVRILALILLSVCITHSASAKNIKKEDFRSWKLAFVRDGNIWTANGDGSEQKLIIKQGCSPAWSPDRKQIAFARNSNVWVANADGTNPKQLTQFENSGQNECGCDSIDISWNSRSNWITFSRWDEYTATRRSDAGFDPPQAERSILAPSIYDAAVGSAGKDKVEVRFDIHSYSGEYHFAYNANPTWSRDGNKLFFVRDGDICIAIRDEEPGMRPGWDITRLAAVASFDGATNRADVSNDVARHMSVSPDERYLVYAFGRGCYDTQLYLLSLKRSGTVDVVVGKKKKLSQSYTPEMWPSFSPDSKYIAYQTQDYEIWVVSVENGERVKIMDNGEQPVW